MSASTAAVLTAEPHEAPPQRRIAVETEALVAGAIAAATSGIVAAFVFAGGLWPLWGGLSVGIVAAVAVLVTGVALGVTGYWRARNLPGQEWRHALRPWKFTIDVATVSAVHAIIGTILTISTFVLLQRSFEGLVVDAWIGMGGTAAAAGLLGYWTYLSVSSITTNKLATLLVVFMATSTLASMATSQDPQWWEYHFSQLGTADDFSSTLFNITLIIAGAFVTTFALYVDRDLSTLVHQGVLEHAWAPRVVSIVFIVMGVMLACVGLFPLNVSMLLHNSSAIGMSLSFLGLLIASPWVLRGMPRRFFVFCGVTVAVLLGGALLFEPVAYWNLTAFELLAFSLIFGWIAVFIRFVDALAAAGGAGDDGGYSV
ncbi:DUF998 domain-containing protein [Agromyces sp. H66]|uniref:DUF998 domain-containing protein n=1 Tax=Agromyces sp. H66 TaxID=2529859 RepID=UPI0010AA0022|nr:DUF998 domain-containing protein [Agromyces sp. H66]